jgi:hypothetical protein
MELFSHFQKVFLRFRSSWPKPHQQQLTAFLTVIFLRTYSSLFVTSLFVRECEGRELISHHQMFLKLIFQPHLSDSFSTA